MLSSQFAIFVFQVEFPPLAAYRLEFGKPEPEPEEVGTTSYCKPKIPSLCIYAYEPKGP